MLQNIKIPECAFEVKAYESSLYPTIQSWWKAHGEEAPLEEMIPESSFVLWIRNQPVAKVSVLMTNTPIAWIDFLIGNPQFKTEERREGISYLLMYLEDFCRKQGKTRLFCMSTKEKTARRYEELGFSRTCSKIESFVKEIV